MEIEPPRFKWEPKHRHRAYRLLFDWQPDGTTPDPRVPGWFVIAEIPPGVLVSMEGVICENAWLNTGALYSLNPKYKRHLMLEGLPLEMAKVLLMAAAINYWSEKWKSEST